MAKHRTKKASEQKPDDRAARMLAWLKGLGNVWTRPSPTEDELITAVMVWRHFPTLYETSDEYVTRHELLRVHGESCLALMAAAQARGIDPRPIWECGQACARYFAESAEFPLHPRRVSDEWPECVPLAVQQTWSIELQRAVAHGDATFRQLVLAAEISVERPASRKPRRNSADIVLQYKAEVADNPDLTIREFAQRIGMKGDAVKQALSRQRKKRRLK